MAPECSSGLCYRLSTCHNRGLVAICLSPSMVTAAFAVRHGNGVCVCARVCGCVWVGEYKCVCGLHVCVRVYSVHADVCVCVYMCVACMSACVFVCLRVRKQWVYVPACSHIHVTYFPQHRIMDVWDWTTKRDLNTDNQFQITSLFLCRIAFSSPSAVLCNRSIVDPPPFNVGDA